MKNFDFVGKRKIFFTISILIILTGLVFGYLNGLNLDIDFKGGTLINVNMRTNQFDIQEVTDIVKDKTGEENSIVLPIGINKDQASIRTPKDLTSNESKILFEALKEKYGLEDADLISQETIDPLIGKELTTKGLRAVLLSSAFTLVYLAIVFRKMGGFVSGLTAIIAIIHDVLVLLSVYLIFHIPINIAFVAAALTILGYSLNDTIIIYDRIRENERINKKLPVAELANISIRQTLGRTINTVVTTLITVFVLYVFGVIYNIEVLQQFTLPLLVGIVSGTYSSIFICSPLYVMWTEYKSKREKAARA